MPDVSRAGADPINFTNELLFMGRVAGAHRIAAVDQYGEWTWADIEDAVTELTDRLATYELAPRSRVLLCADDSIWHQIALFACANLGLILVPVSARASASDIRHATTLTGPSLGLLSTSKLNSFDVTEAEASDHRIGPFVLVSWLRERTDLSSIPMQRTPFLITLTSGSMAAPKPVLYSAEGELAVTKSHASLWRLNTNDVVLTGAPQSWIYGLSTIDLAGLVAGAQVIIPPRFSPTVMCELAQARDVTVFVGVTTHLRILLDHFDNTGNSPFGSKLRMIVSGAERRDEELFARVESAFGVPVYDLYASSECRPGFGYDPLLYPRPVGLSCGKLIPGTEARIVPGKFNTGSDGVLELRSPGNFLGYFDPITLVREEITTKDWIPLGDLFCIDENGWGYVTGRTKEVIIRGGANISPSAVENALSTHPGVHEVSVVGIPSRDYGEEVAAVVVGAFGSAAEAATQLKEYCSDRLSEFQIPTTFALAESLPRNANGKVDQAQVRSMVTQSNATSA